MKRTALVVLGYLAPLAACATLANEPAPLDPPVVPLGATATLERGTVQVLVNPRESWRGLRAEDIQQHVTELATQEGAVLLLAREGSLAGRLWLKAGTRARVGRATDGSPRIHVIEGAARLRLLGTADARDTLHLPGAAPELPTAQHVDQAAWAFALGEDVGAAGVGTLAVRGSDDLAYLELRSLDVRATLAGDMVEARVEHTFFNPTDTRLEGTFRFPVPPGALVTGLELEVDGQMIDGEIVEREKAQRIYDEIVDQMQDPAILEWEGGNTFKLRVFPLEPKQPKRVALRYLAPLQRSGDRWVFAYPTAAPALQDAIGHFRLSLDGQVALDQAAFKPGRTVEVPLRAAPAAVLSEELADATFYAVRLQGADLLAGRSAPQALSEPRDLVLIVDTSRSMLEERALLREATLELLGGLGPADRFVLVAQDLQARGHAEALVPAQGEQVTAALAFLDAIEPDGASDLGAALDLAGALLSGPAAGRRAQVVLLGDGQATWGSSDPDALVDLAHRRLGATPFFAVAVGKQVDRPLLDRFAAAQDGFVAAPGTLADVRAFEATLGAERSLPRLQGVRVDAPEGVSVHPQTLGTVLPGSTRTVLVRVPKGAPMPSALALGNGAGWSTTLPLGTAESAAGVARRWAAAEIAHLERSADAKDAVIALSQTFRVLSRHTAWLVLESDEMYKRFQIERTKEAASAPTVTGADLESVAGAEPRLDPDHIQPGDPEIRIPAPADARSVVVELPFGETKEARFEPDLNAWTVRFLIPHDTRDGKYWVHIHVVHADGHSETVQLPYWVDTTAPTVTVKLRPKRRSPGTWEILAEQVVTQVEWEEAMPGKRRTAAHAKRHLQILADIRRVDVGLPDGTTLALTALGGGRFRGAWKPAEPLASAVTLRVVAVDTALNPSVTEVQVGTDGRVRHAP